MSVEIVHVCYSLCICTCLHQSVCQFSARVHVCFSLSGISEGLLQSECQFKKKKNKMVEIQHDGLGWED